MDGSKRLTRVLASGFVLAGGLATFSWFWPEDGAFLPGAVAVLAAAVSLLVVASLWKK